MNWEKILKRLGAKGSAKNQKALKRFVDDLLRGKHEIEFDGTPCTLLPLYSAGESVTPVCFKMVPAEPVTRVECLPGQQLLPGMYEEIPGEF
jgi:hypothetical protein